MDKIELLRKVNDWSQGPPKADYYTEDFQLTNAQGGPPSDRDATLGMAQLMKAAIPDIRTVIEEIREDGEDVVQTSHWEGTFTNDFDLSAMGLGVVPATGKAIVFPTSTIRVSFDGDRISRIHDTATGPDAGTSGFFKTIGVELG